MQPSMNRRTFVQALVGLPALSVVRPRAVPVQTSTTRMYTDDIHTKNLAALNDSDRATGVRYGA